MKRKFRRIWIFESKNGEVEKYAINCRSLTRSPTLNYMCTIRLTDFAANKFPWCVLRHRECKIHTNKIYLSISFSHPFSVWRHIWWSLWPQIKRERRKLSEKLAINHLFVSKWSRWQWISAHAFRTRIRYNAPFATERTQIDFDCAQRCH